MSVIAPPPPSAPPAPPAHPASGVALRVGAVITGLLIILGALNLFQLTAVRDSTTSRYDFATSSTTLLLDSDSADITVVAGDAGRLTVDRHASTAHGHSLGAPKLTGTTLQLPADCHGSGLGWFTFCSVSYTVHVPAGLDLSVRTGSGDLTMTDVTARTTSATTGSGDVEMAGLLSADTAVDTGSGDVDLVLGQAPTTLKASTGSGDLTVSVPRDSAAYTVHEHSGSGNFTNHLLSSDQAPTGSVTHVLTVSTGSGDLTLRYAD